MSARDALAAVIVEAYGENPDLCPCEQDLDVADHILAAGYRKPRTITTEDELDALPKGSVLLSHLGGVWTKYYDHYLEGDNWEAKGSSHIHADDLPATVLHEPSDG